LGVRPQAVFSLLDKRIRERLKKEGLKRPTLAQSLSIPPVLEGKNVLLIAPTGLGKTEAAALPLLHRLLNEQGKPMGMIYITPLRALNRDMLARLTGWGEALGLTVAVRHGDTPQSERTRQSKHPPDLLITTPETLQILFTGKHLRNHLSNVRHVVIDEIHELAQDERGAQLSVVLERLVALTGREVQRIGLSATVGNSQDIADFLGGVGREVTILHAELDKKMDLVVECPKPNDDDRDTAHIIMGDDKSASVLRRARDLMEDHRSTLLFTNTREGAEVLATRFHLWNDQLGVGVHHGSLSKDVRVEMEEAFKSQDIRTLICTSSLELGIDVGSADFTIQYNSPRQVNRMIQRLGRSGHGVGRVSRGVILATSPDDVAESAVIARRLLEREIEPIRIRKNPLTVLANQLVAEAVHLGKMDPEEFYRMVRRSYPFRDLSHELFQSVLDELVFIRTLWRDGDMVGKRRASLGYFYENISMIPDERTYRVVDITSRKTIGTLDEGFVVGSLELYGKFIVKGRPWRVVDIQDGEILVEPVADMGVVPGWMGEEIPVPFEVAEEVGRVRGDPELLGVYPVDSNSREIFQAYLSSQEEKPVPTHRLVTVERDRDIMIINAAFGNRINEALGRMVSSLLASRAGSAVGLSVDPYRIILSSNLRIPPQRVVDILSTSPPNVLEGILRAVLKNSSVLKWNLVYVGRKFGAIKRDLDIRKVNVRTLLDRFTGTVIFHEAVERLLFDRMDVEGGQRVLDRMRDGDIQVEISAPSPVGLAGLEHHNELISPERADREVLEAMGRRLEEERVRLVCINCHAQRTSRVRYLEEPITCHRCSGRLMAAVNPRETDVVRFLKRKPRNHDERLRMKRIRKSADLVMGHGKRAILAIVGRGVGPDTAGRILRGYYDDDLEFLREILKAEVLFSRTHRFWD